MVLFLTAFMVSTALAASPTVPPTAPLASRVLPAFLIVVPDAQGLNFDLYDVRAELAEPQRQHEGPPHSIFAIKRHVGIAAGYDNGIVHGSLGLYLTVAQLGRWNFGVTSPEIGFGRYREINQRTRQPLMKTESTVLISLASVHYRGGYIRSIGKDWYFTLEQIYDSRANLTGSQFGISFSNP
jgi:hypothetical protein